MDFANFQCYLGDKSLFQEIHSDHFDGSGKLPYLSCVHKKYLNRYSVQCRKPQTSFESLRKKVSFVRKTELNWTVVLRKKKEEWLARIDIFTIRCHCVPFGCIKAIDRTFFAITADEFIRSSTCSWLVISPPPLTITSFPEPLSSMKVYSKLKSLSHHQVLLHLQSHHQICYLHDLHHCPLCYLLCRLRKFQLWNHLLRRLRSHMPKQLD